MARIREPFPAESSSPQSKISVNAPVRACSPWRALALVAAPLARAGRSPAPAPAPRRPAAPAAPARAATVCGQPIPPRARSRRRAPARSSSSIAPCFEAQGNASVIEPQTYLYYIQLKASRPSQGVWVPVRRRRPRRRSVDDFQRLWNTNFLDNLSIDVSDYTFPNGVDRQARHLQHGGAAARQDRRLHRLEEGRAHEDRREAEGSRTSQIRLDTFIDPGAGPQGRGHRPRHDDGEGLPVRRGHATRSRRCRAARSWCTSPSTSTKGRRSRSGTIDFVGNKAISDGKLKRQMKENKERMVPVVSSPAAAPTRKPSSTKTRRRSSSTTATSGYIKAQRRRSPS